MASGQSTFATTAAGAPTSYSEISAVEMNSEPGHEPSDVPGNYAEYTTPPLAQNTDVIGLPTVDVHVSAPVQLALPGTTPATNLVLFFKLYDLSPTGHITLPDKLIAPVRIPSTGATIHVDLPGIVHRFPAGDRIALVVAGGDQAYRGNNVPGPVTISTSPSAPGGLHLPVAGAGSYGPVVYASSPGNPSNPGSAGSVPRRGCPLSSGRLAGTTLGGARLGETRAAARRAFRLSSNRGRRYMDFFCLTPNGIRVGYPSPKLLVKLRPRLRRSVRGSAVLALTASPRYALRGVPPRTRLAMVAHRLRAGRPFHIGLNDWYLVGNGSSTGVLKVRHGVIEEVGIADKRLTGTRRADRWFLGTFS